jgi:hypothetical protein
VWIRIRVSRCLLDMYTSSHLGTSTWEFVNFTYEHEVVQPCAPRCFARWWLLYVHDWDILSSRSAAPHLQLARLKQTVNLRGSSSLFLFKLLEKILGANCTHGHTLVTTVHMHALVPSAYTRHLLSHALTFDTEGELSFKFVTQQCLPKNLWERNVSFPYISLLRAL